MRSFSAYFDESGTPDETHVILTVAGFVSSDQKWVRFEIAWKKILKDAGLPDGTVFHMNRFARNLPPYEAFAGQSKRKAAFIESLIACTRRHVHKAFSCSVVLRDWEHLNLRYCVSESLGFPYSFCGRTCIGTVLKWAKKNEIPEVKFFFESGAKHRDQFERIMKIDDGIVPLFLPKAAIVQFQAADLLAWKSRKVLAEVVNYEGPPNRDVYDSINRSLAGIRCIPHKYGVHSYESMLPLIRAAAIPRRQ